MMRNDKAETIYELADRIAGATADAIAKVMRVRELAADRLRLRALGISDADDTRDGQ